LYRIQHVEGRIQIQEAEFRRHKSEVRIQYRTPKPEPGNKWLVASRNSEPGTPNPELRTPNP
jgi:hypothetical protein